MTTATNLRAVPFARRFMTFTWAVIGIVVLVMVAFAFVQPSILVDTLVTGGMWALMAGGLALVFGVMNIPNFAHGEFFMIGSLVAFTVFGPIHEALLANPDSTVLQVFGPFPGMLVAAAVGFAVGLILEVFLFRPLRRG
jgi:branched-chain amino acid transport system permease protein